jgi:hypothetical protein
MRRTLVDKPVWFRRSNAIEAWREERREEIQLDRW